MKYNSGLPLIVLIISCFLARFNDQPQVGGKRRVYMKKRFLTVTETGREKSYKG